ncbi:diphosphate--fructose-6-phosphate 1-phosphotransferase [Chlamydia muridarum str. Nigg]|uniref:6-phosphofructokinase n=2 Tax=Chlamydia muridarum TaxID=83560 RepID=A0A070A2K4_CHLMR|nr:diphosphate--fructose-6-phosphate 1-phosphotransferase [Chlamydia muridarum]UFW99734.1 diphosphate--fructose-6-phosphate 1-phosphotransferase [Chlamydia trachomatis]AAF39325.1 pyrophosphate--fructose 6-phosphate 1-phosphotransferase, beta subunit [Chlamydia muridarum str. Nigg]AHH22865.1 diphosphate--fructose-6-phosphate 1-phosphotransferase [Chlamydia muridarum str. Nigg3 CMUT3-5]AHH23790.1 diphosphate--fructose-6-phosphate 1-phosphotransferase [Chlamydia muridarum str. Nigg CM972]AID38000
MELLSVNKSYFELQRLHYRPVTLALLDNLCSLHIKESASSEPNPGLLAKHIPHLCALPNLTIQKGDRSSSEPLRIGVLLSGGQAPGGHNVVIGLFEGLRAFNKETKLFGFIKGPLGLIRGLYKDLDISVIYDYYNAGGFDMLSSSKEKIKTKEQKSAILSTVKKMKLHGLLIVGGDNSNTDTAMLAEYFIEHNCPTAVIGVPKTIDGDLKNSWIETPLGFHTSCRTYSEMIGNLEKDILSTRKYHHFVKLMGEQASHSTLECGLQALPNITLIGEEVAIHHTSLRSLSHHIARGLIKRFRKDKNYSTILIPEGLIKQIPDTKLLIHELNALIAEGQFSVNHFDQQLSPMALQTFSSLPENIREQLLLDRDSYGNVRVSKIAIEELLASLVSDEIAKLEPTMPFAPVTHFLGYESRASFPSNFDSNYGLALGIAASLFLVRGKTGYMVTIGNLAEEYAHWTIAATPLYKMMHLEKRFNEETPVIKTDSVSPHSPMVQYLHKIKEACLLEDLYRFPGPLQYFEEQALIDQRPLTLLWEKGALSENNANRL